jgi:hypothetical protein
MVRMLIREIITAGLVYDLRCWKMRKMERINATTTKHPAVMRAG